MVLLKACLFLHAVIIQLIVVVVYLSCVGIEQKNYHAKLRLLDLRQKQKICGQLTRLLSLLSRDKIEQSLSVQLVQKKKFFQL